MSRKQQRSSTSSDKPLAKSLYWSLTFGIGGFGKVFKGEVVTKTAREALESNGSPLEAFTYSK